MSTRRSSTARHGTPCRNTAFRPNAPLPHTEADAKKKEAGIRLNRSVCRLLVFPVSSVGCPLPPGARCLARLGPGFPAAPGASLRRLEPTGLGIRQPLFRWLGCSPPAAGRYRHTDPAPPAGRLQGKCQLWFSVTSETTSTSCDDDGPLPSGCSGWGFPASPALAIKIIPTGNACQP